MQTICLGKNYFKCRICRQYLLLYKRLRQRDDICIRLKLINIILKNMKRQIKKNILYIKYMENLNDARLTTPRPTTPTQTQTPTQTPTTPCPTDPTDIVNFTLNETINGLGTTTTNQQGTTASGTEETHTTLLTTTDVTSDINITENLIGTVKEYNDELNNSPSGLLLNDIKMYAGKIQCTDFHGKGTIDDYTVLFESASRIANETKQMQLNIDVEGFTEFGQAADDLSKLFNSFIVRLQTVNIIDDTVFLASILDALKKIFNLSEVFGRFKETILATATIQMPKSAHDTKVVLENVMDELSCAMNYISYFVTSTGTSDIQSNAQLSSTEQTIINTAVSTIDNWNTLCEQGVSISLDTNTDIQYIKQANIDIHQKTLALKSATATLKSKLSVFNINQ